MSTVSVTVRIQDVNDNYPAFDKKQYRRVIDEDATEFRPPFFIKVTHLYNRWQKETGLTHSKNRQLTINSSELSHANLSGSIDNKNEEKKEESDDI